MITDVKPTLNVILRISQMETKVGRMVSGSHGHQLYMQLGTRGREVDQLVFSGYMVV